MAIARSVEVESLLEDLGPRGRKRHYLRISPITRRFQKLIQRANLSSSPEPAGFIKALQFEGLDLEKMTYRFRENAAITAYFEHQGNQVHAAKWLGIHRTTYRNLLLRALSRMEKDVVREYATAVPTLKRPKVS